MVLTISSSETSNPIFCFGGAVQKKGGLIAKEKHMVLSSEMSVPAGQRRSLRSLAAQSPLWIGLQYLTPRRADCLHAWFWSGFLILKIRSHCEDSQTSCAMFLHEILRRVISRLGTSKRKSKDFHLSSHFIYSICVRPWDKQTWVSCRICALPKHVSTVLVNINLIQIHIIICRAPGFSTTQVSQQKKTTAGQCSQVNCLYTGVSSWVNFAHCSAASALPPCWDVWRQRLNSAE